jgi:rhamnogalacturonyl hydrolase YesR
MLQRLGLLLLVALNALACTEGEPAKALGGASGGGALNGGAGQSAGGASGHSSGGGGKSGEAGSGVAPAAGSGGAAAGSGGDGAAGSGGAGGSAGAGGVSSAYPPRAEIIEVLSKVNAQFADKWPDFSVALPGNRPSHIWTRGVYYEGLMALYAIDPQPSYKAYALDWAEYHNWGLRSPVTNADNQCAGQTYLDLYELDGKAEPERIAAIRASAQSMVDSADDSAWTWVDAIQMSMPVFVKLGRITGDQAFYEKAYDLYAHTRNIEGGGLYDTSAHLWWRDAEWKPDQQQTPSGKDVLWSRGNGWVYAALARVLEELPQQEPHRTGYERDFLDMSEALKLIQRSDGFWSSSLADPEHYGGPELTGTALFAYGMAWGIERGLLDETTYAPIVVRAWQGMVQTSVQPDGFLGYVQSTGDSPDDGQPLSATKMPDFEDYGVGCFLLAGSALAKLSKP